MSPDEDPLEIDSPAAYNEDTPSTNKKGLHLYPVSASDSGEGLPYAPADWPNPGDKWSWKVGKRIASSGYFLDRYLYLPNHLRGKQSVFASKLSVEQYIRSEFPSMDISEFFASFSWKIPSKLFKGDWYSGITSSGMKSDIHLGTIRCMAGNNMCVSLVAGNPSPETMICDICCSEPGFCRDCCCILCCKTICSAYGGYSYIRCEAKVNDGEICGHIAHMDCALRSYVAGTVGGSIGLDAEYFCRRCDSISDLVFHVMKLLNICRTIDSRDDIESILNVGLCILRGSRKANAKQLLRHIKLAMAKLRKGASIADVFKEEIFMDANENLIGEGGSSEVYKGHLEDGQLVAIKRLIRGTQEEMTADYLSELGILVHVKHPNIAGVIGYGVEGGMHLVLPLSPHGSLENLLNGEKSKLTWCYRYNISLGAAAGLGYLHEGCRRRIIHRDIKTANILLTEDFEPQISDFGLAKWLPDQWTHLTASQFEGTFGYLPPEFFMHGIVDEKTDVYAFGVLLLELISGRPALDESRNSVVMWAKPMLLSKNHSGLVDPSLGDAYDSEQMNRMVMVASLCIQQASADRLQMSQVHKMLKGTGGILERMKTMQNASRQRGYIPKSEFTA